MRESYLTDETNYRCIGGTLTPDEMEKLDAVLESPARVVNCVIACKGLGDDPRKIIEALADVVEGCMFFIKKVDGGDMHNANAYGVMKERFEALNQLGLDLRDGGK